MPTVDKGTVAVEEPWVTELLRDVLLEEAFTPVWRYATEYHPCAASAMEAIRMLPIQERDVVCALYRDELPLETAYRKLNISAAIAANMLSCALAQLRKPCLLRIILKGKAACERESSMLKALSVEDIMLLGVETLSIPVEACDTYSEVGARTIENLMCSLIYGLTESQPIPVAIQEMTRSRMDELNLWVPLKRYLLSEENLWWQRLYSCAMTVGCRQGSANGKNPTKERALSTLANLSAGKKAVLMSIYAHGASERMFARREGLPEDAVMELHRQSLVEFARTIWR